MLKKSFLFFILFSNFILLNISALFEPHLSNRTEGRICEVAICCVFKNEAEWLKEWIEFHRLIGVEHFYLYNNLSTDNYMAVLSPYIELGLVELFDFAVTPFTNKSQPEIYNHAIGLSKGLSEWLAIIDTDEFIVPVETKSIADYMRNFPQNIGGIEINWQTFGTSRVKTLKPGELLIEKLIFKAPIHDPANGYYKTIVRPEVSKSINAHRCEYLPGYQCQIVNPQLPGGVPLNEEAVSKIRINHYVFRTEDYFYAVKLPRIRQWNENHFQGIYIYDYLEISNQVLDTSMNGFIDPLKSILFPNKIQNETL